MTNNEMEKRLAQIQEVEPDEFDKKMLSSIEDGNEIELSQFKKDIEYSGKISLRLPKSLHRELTYSAKNEGVSLNQYLLYKLSH